MVCVRKFRCPRTLHDNRSAQAPCYTPVFDLASGVTTAEVAELADALASGASDRKVMKVRVLSSAPFDSAVPLGAASLMASRAVRSAARYPGLPRSQGRVEDHQVGRGGAYTSRRLPVVLVHSEELPDLAAALLRERQIKRWTRRKKQALIRGDLTNLRKLARRTLRNF